jgi:hypothetical protein
MHFSAAVKQRNDGVTAVGQGAGQFATKQAAGAGEEDAQRMVHALSNGTASFWVRAAGGDRDLVIGGQLGPRCAAPARSPFKCPLSARWRPLPRLRRRSVHRTETGRWVLAA